LRAARNAAQTAPGAARPHPGGRRPLHRLRRAVPGTRRRLVAGRRSCAMTVTITAFEKSPDGGKGLARDTRVRWALEEAGQPYQVRLVSRQAMKEEAHLRLQPFGQIPTFEEDDLVLFETGAIVFHIAQRHAGLL